MKISRKLLLIPIAAFALFLAAPSILPAGSSIGTVEAKKVYLSKKKLTLKMGKKKKLVIRNRGGKKVSWHSTNHKVAIAHRGVVTAKAPGKCTIYAMYGKKKLTCALKVTDLNFSVAKSSLTLKKNESQTILVYSERKSSISVKTSNKYIATATPLTGPGAKMPIKITGESTAGTATITITEKKTGRTRVINVTVSGSNTFSVSPANVTLDVGETQSIWVRSDLRINPNFSSANEGTIIRLAWGGNWSGNMVPLKITGLAAGQDTITLTETDSKNKTRKIQCTVTVE